MFVIRNDCYRTSASIPWSFDYIKNTNDSALISVKQSYAKFEELTQDLTHGWHQKIIRPADPLHIYYFDIFGLHMTQESIMHVAHLYRRKFIQEFAEPWFRWATDYRLSNNISLERRIVQMSNPTVGSNSWLLASYPA